MYYTYMAVHKPVLVLLLEVEDKMLHGKSPKYTTKKVRIHPIHYIVLLCN